MAAVAPEARTRRPLAAQTRRQPVKSRVRPKTAQRRLAGGVVWIVLVAALLAGVVALNVAVLRLNLRFDELGQQRAKLRAEDATLASKLASAAASARIQRLAHDQLGVIPASPPQTFYVRLHR